MRFETIVERRMPVAVPEERDLTAWLREVMRVHEGPLLRYALKFCGNLERAKDAVQDTFVRLCCEPRDRVEDHVGPWLYTVCRHRLLEIHRKEKWLTPAADGQLDSFRSREPSPAVAAEAADTSGEILRLLDALPPRQQEVIRLKFQDGLSYRDISRITGLSESNVGFLICMGMKQLREKARRVFDAGPRPQAHDRNGV